ncbi:MAG: hypothetical protein INR64_13675 [Caulobacteraceae bacterium]|nr:hypothetical protein [Caulobacter sp.]
MIHLIHSGNRHLYADALDNLHAARHRHFVVERGWPLDHRDGRERDAYDDAQALHLVSVDANGDIGVSCRVRPTLTGGVLPDHFPNLLDAGAPSLRAPHVYECTRYFAAPHLRGRRGFALRSRLHIALLELMILRRAERLFGFVDLPLLGHLRRYSGLRLRPIGTPQPYDDVGVAVAFEIGVTAADLSWARQRLDQPGRSLFDCPPWLPETLAPAPLAELLDVFLNVDGGQADLLDAARRLAGREGRRDAGRAYARLRNDAA